MKKSCPERLLRLKKGIDGRVLAKAVGIGPGTLYDYETGRRKWNQDTRKKILEWLRNRSAG